MSISEAPQLDADRTALQEALGDIPVYIGKVDPSVYKPQLDRHSTTPQRGKHNDVYALLMDSDVPTPEEVDLIRVNRGEVLGNYQSTSPDKDKEVVGGQIGDFRTRILSKSLKGWSLTYPGQRFETDSQREPLPLTSLLNGS